MLFWPLLCGFIGETNQSLHAMSCEDRDFSTDLPRLSTVGASTLACVFTFAVLSDDDPIKISGGSIAKRALCAFENLCRSHVGVLLEWLADGQTKAPKGDVIGYVYHES